MPKAYRLEVLAQHFAKNKYKIIDQHLLLFSIYVKTSNSKSKLNDVIIIIWSTIVVSGICLNEHLENNKLQKQI